MKENPVGWFEIYVNDMNRAKSFYESVLATTLGPLPMPEGSEGMEMLAFPMDNPMGSGATGALVKMSGFGPASAGTIVYFSCEDCAVESSRVEAAGGEVLQPKQSIGEYGFISILKDTESNIIGLHSQQ